jgi:hypothetical protein
MVRLSALGAFAWAAWTWGAQPVAHADEACEQIEEGGLAQANGQPLTPGMNELGYDYELQKFEGSYCQTLADPAQCAYEGVALTMHWNDAWLSNEDSDGDSYLDRHDGFASYRGSGAELTNIMRGTIEQNGETCDWHYVYWISAAPLDATLTGGVWYASNGTKLGSQLWTDFAIVGTLYQEVCGEELANDGP